MNTPLAKLSLLTAAVPLLANALAAQEAELNFVREWVGFRVVEDFAPNPNNIEQFNDYCIDFQEDPSAQGGNCGNVSPHGIAYEDFLGMLSGAFAEGRGGVINFETAILGPAYRDFDRRGHRAFMDNFILENPLENYDAAVRRNFPELGDADVLALSTWLQQQDAYAAAEEALLDPTETIPVVARPDRSREDDEDRPQLEGLTNADVIGFYGPEKDIPLVISRGERSYTEGQLATPNFPAPWDLGGMINGQFFTNVGISTYSGGNAYRPVSGINTFNSGMHDMIFDPRDNVKAVGFVFLTYGNFQYYQGDSGVPVNPNNMRVFVEFSNGESEELAHTSRQSSGNWDVFFGIAAPEGASIVRLWLRVVGRNWRTFVAIDDLAFITEPGVSYVVGDTAFTGSEGAEFYEIIQTGQNAQSVTISDLPPGLSFDEASGVIEGTFTSSGTYESTVTLTNVVGTSEETLTFVVGPAQDPAGYLSFDELDPVNVVLRRELAPVIITSNLDDVLPAGSITYFTRVERILDGGSREETTLDFLGLTLRDNRITGTPGAAQQIGTYEITVYGRTLESASRTSFLLTVLAPTQAPNFDANKTTDFGVLSNGALMLAYNPADPGNFGDHSLQSALAGIPSGASVFMGDFNGDNQADLLAWDSAGGSVRLYSHDAESLSFSEAVLLDGILSGSGETIVAASDFNGNGTADLLWSNPSRDRITVWLLDESGIKWAGVQERTGGAGEIVTVADFAGDGRNAILTRTGAGRYALEQFDLFSSLGKIESTRIEFTVPSTWEPVAFADFTNDGRADILWTEAETGLATLWPMRGLAGETSYFEVSDAGALTGVPDRIVFPMGFNWSVVTAADLNNDQFADVILRNRGNGDLGLLTLRDGKSAGIIRLIGDAAKDIRTVGDFDGDGRNDLLAEYRASRALEIISLSADSTIRQVPYGQSPASAEWLTGVGISNETAGIDFSYDLFGANTFVNGLWMFTGKWGYIAPVFVDMSRAGWYYDAKLGYVWTSPAVYPWVLQGRSQFWLWHVPGSLNPKWFYNPLFPPPLDYMTEDDPLLQ